MSLFVRLQVALAARLAELRSDRERGTVPSPPL